jgi:hypothetical protein
MIALTVLAGVLMFVMGISEDEVRLRETGVMLSVVLPVRRCTVAGSAAALAPCRRSAVGLIAVGATDASGRSTSIFDYGRRYRLVRAVRLAAPGTGTPNKQ